MNPSCCRCDTLEFPSLIRKNSFFLSACLKVEFITQNFKCFVLQDIRTNIQELEKSKKDCAEKNDEQVSMNSTRGTKSGVTTSTVCYHHTLVQKNHKVKQSAHLIAIF